MIKTLPSGARVISMRIAKIEINRSPVKMSIARSSPERWKKLSHRNYTSKRLSTVNNSRAIFRRSRQFLKEISWKTTIAIIIQMSKIRMADPIIETSREKAWVTRSSHIFPRICPISSKRRLLMTTAQVESSPRIKNTISKVDSVNFKALPVLATKVKIKKTLWVPPRSILTETCSVASSVIMFQKSVIQFSPSASWTRKPHPRRWIITDNRSKVLQWILTKSIRDRPWVTLSTIGITVSIIFQIFIIYHFL